jgi:ABC-type multidrug transport system fused ATPase/permease subunit
LNPELNSSSGGETQRIALARAIYRNPEILLLDEITSGLDEKNNALILEAIFHLPMTVILVSHNLPSALEKQLDGRINL